MGIVLQTGNIVFLDTAPFVYFFEQHPIFFPYMEKFFYDVSTRQVEVITSIITFIEILTLPARMGNQELVEQYRTYFTRSSQITLLPIDLSIANHAIALRTQYTLKTPDAIQLGTAIAHSATYIITNDRQRKQLTHQNVLLVDEM
ncbi:PIN domain-containing protein [Microcystis flos-aquae FACHB-1344]|uniref:PIN domain-containing protein n=1 Tax=Microcystis flos-aquae FACHB-1344 TaxID=2692899 RepID=A0ABR8HRV7_9CHRO|nr:PIN domain-containing protein [Microcystis flos-aquae]MBD2621264.1 PIN domain-containing protein [Microcystis flos-aquae FACHB-1344]